MLWLSFFVFVWQLPCTVDIAGYLQSILGSDSQDSIQEPSPFTKSETTFRHPNITNSGFVTREDHDGRVASRFATTAATGKCPPSGQAQDPKWHHGYTAATRTGVIWGGSVIELGGLSKNSEGKKSEQPRPTENKHKKQHSNKRQKKKKDKVSDMTSKSNNSNVCSESRHLLICVSLLYT